MKPTDPKGAKPPFLFSLWVGFPGAGEADPKGGSPLRMQVDDLLSAPRRGTSTLPAANRHDEAGRPGAGGTTASRAQFFIP